MASEEGGGFQFTYLPCPVLGSIKNKSKDIIELLDKWCDPLIVLITVSDMHVAGVLEGD